MVSSNARSVDKRSNSEWLKLGIIFMVLIVTVTSYEMGYNKGMTVTREHYGTMETLAEKCITDYASMNLNYARVTTKYVGCMLNASEIQRP